MLSLTTVLPVEDKRVGIRQWDFPIFNWNTAVSDNHTPVCNFDLALKMDGFCGRATEYRVCRL
jgi:hypothetical protein